MRTFVNVEDQDTKEILATFEVKDFLAYLDGLGKNTQWMTQRYHNAFTYPHNDEAWDGHFL